MNPDPLYVLDTSVFTQAARSYYAFDLAPRFWSELERFASLGRNMSVDRVKDEIDRGKDPLQKWASESVPHIFITTDDHRTVKGFREIMKWIQESRQYKTAVKEGFAHSADGWVVAYAGARGFTVVSLETSAPNSVWKVKIPDICRKFKVQHIDTFQMLRELGIRFQ